MSGKTNYLEGKIIDLVLRNTAYGPITPYVGLFTAAPSDAGGGTEVTGGAYARQAVTFAAPSGTPRTTSNSADVNFPQASADWGTVTHFGIFDADTGGNLLYWAALGAQKTISNGDTAKFLAGDLDLTED